jgi:serine/threonine protein kinase
VICINPACQAVVAHETDRCPECGTDLRLLDRYVLIRPLREINPLQGVAVYDAYDQKLGNECIVKVLLYPKPPHLKQFEREAASLANLRHPGLPKVDIDDDGYFTIVTTAKQYPELHCFVMEKIPGVTLAQWLTQSPLLSQNQAIDWLGQIVVILHELHRHKIFHRDIKPSNIILKPDGQLVLIDFGAVRDVTSTYLSKLAGSNTQFDGVTIVNSAGYTPYEQTQGQAVMQSDFYALGHTLIHLLTGISPTKIQKTDQGRLLWRESAPQICPPLADLLDQMSALMPSDRPANTAAIQAALVQLPVQIKRHQWRQSPIVKGVQILGTLCLAAVAFKGATWYLSERYLSAGLEAALKGDLTVAQSNLESAILYHPENSALYSNLATVCQQQNSVTGDACAVKYYQQALSLNPRNVQARYNFASFYSDIGELPKAIEQYTIVINDSPGFVDAWNNLARLQIIQNQYENAENSLSRVMPQAKDSLSQSAIQKNLGWLRYQQKRYPEASQALSKAIQLSPEARTDAYCLLAKIQDRQPRKSVSNEFWQNCLSGEASTPEVRQWQDEKLNLILPSNSS